jgi:hypothetical protein
MTTAERRLESLIDRFSPQVAADARVAIEKMRALVPGALELVYDNYNALVVGFCPNERASDGIFSIAVFPRHVTLCFLQGAALPDPDGILKGSGSVVRTVRLETQTTIDEPAVQRTIALALDLARVRIDSNKARRLEIRAVSAKQRPRRPAPRAVRPLPAVAQPDAANSHP